MTGPRTLDLAYRQVLWLSLAMLMASAGTTDSSSLTPLVPGVWVAVSPDFDVLRLGLNLTG